MELPDILNELKAGNRPKSRRYKRLAEGQYLTDAQRTTTMIVYRVLQVIILAGLSYFLIRILS
jgi:hypothetical protein